MLERLRVLRGFLAYHVLDVVAWPEWLFWQLAIWAADWAYQPDQAKRRPTSEARHVG